MSTETIVILDLETTGIDTETCEVVEIAALKLRGNYPGPLEVVDSFWSLVKPEGPLPPEASAVHHIVGVDLDGAPSVLVAMHNQEGCLVDFMSGVDVVVGHNINTYDAPILDRLGVGLPCLLDTIRLAHHTFSELEQVGNATPSYGLEALRWRFGLHPRKGDWGEGHARWAPHAAAFDVATCRALLAYCVAAMGDMTGSSYAGVADQSLMPYRVHVMPFGKHRGQRLENIPRDYIRWALANMDAMDDDLRASLRVWR